MCGVYAANFGTAPRRVENYRRSLYCYWWCWKTILLQEKQAGAEAPAIFRKPARHLTAARPAPHIPAINRLLEELPPEANSVVDGWAALHTPARNAYQTQALIHLKTRYCDAKRCLECGVGNAILK